MKPTQFEDLIALVALYRPGPMQNIPSYAARKNGKEPVTFIDERLKPITGTTFGITVYQEQTMEIAKEVAGFSPAEADDLSQGDRQEDPLADGVAEAPRAPRSSSSPEMRSSAQWSWTQ